MGQRHREIGESQELRACRCLPVQYEHGFTSPVRQHFHFSPPDSYDAGAKRLRRRFLCREARGELGNAGTIPFSLAFRVNPSQKALAEIIERALDSSDLDDV